MINEKNYFMVDRIMEKILLADDSLKPQTALDWCITASNCLENVSHCMNDHNISLLLFV